ncbi:MAG: twitch domain-containing radical SAM protein [Bacteriovoracaceae bacterium]|nr:twitch domain-containing radical SAM protein [Bacteriovoracaceae bacterium]
MLISPNGKIYTCYEASDCLGEINEIPLADILNSYKSKLIKEKMSKDEIVPQCEFCILKENTQKGESLQSVFLQEFKSINTNITSSPIEEIESVDLSFSNLCNMKCLTCSSEYSSRWSSENTIVTYTNYIKKNIFPLLNQLKKITIAGGEPFIQSEIIEFLEELIRLKRTDIRLEFNSNGSSIKTSYIKNLKKFNNLQISISIDGINGDAQNIRPGIAWEKIERNIKVLKNELPNADITSYTTISSLNIQNFPEMVHYFIDNDLFELRDVALHYLRTPEKYSIQNLNEKTKMTIEENYNLLIKQLMKKKLPLSQVIGLSRRIRLINKYMTSKKSN